MSDPSLTPPGHLDELLAGYVDGSAAPDVRARVESHLAGCEACRAELDLAVEARRALAGLPELETPDVAAAVARELGLDRSGDGRAGVAPLAERRASNRSALREWAGRQPWGGWAAAAAVFAAVGILAGSVLTGGGGANDAGTALAPAQETAAPEGGDAGPGTAHTTASIDALARTLAGEASFEGDLREDTAAPGAPVPAPSPGSAETAAPGRSSLARLREQVEACLRSTGNAPPSAELMYLEAEATFDGIPAYVGGFLLPREEAVRVVVVGSAGCAPLYAATHPR